MAVAARPVGNSGAAGGAGGYGGGAGGQGILVFGGGGGGGAGIGAGVSNNFGTRTLIAGTIAGNSAKGVAGGNGWQLPGRASAAVCSITAAWSGLTAP